MWEGPAHWGWCHTWEGGPGEVVLGGIKETAEHKLKSASQQSYCLCFGLCLQVPALASLGDIRIVIWKCEANEHFISHVAFGQCFIIAAQTKLGHMLLFCLGYLFLVPRLYQGFVQSYWEHSYLIFNCLCWIVYLQPHTQCLAMAEKSSSSIQALAAKCGCQ